MSGGGGHTQHNADTIGTAQLRAFIERVERIEADIAERNADKSEVYKEMRGSGFDVKTVRKIVAKRKLDTADREEQDAIFDLYWTALYGGGESPSRVHVHEGKKSTTAKGASNVGNSGQHIGRSDGEQRGPAPVQGADGRREGGDDSDQGFGARALGTDRRGGPVAGTVDCQDQDGRSGHVGREAHHEITQSGDDAIGEVKGSARLPNATGVEPPSPERSRTMSMSPLEPREAGGLKGFGFTVKFDDAVSVEPSSPAETEKAGEVPLASSATISDADVPAFLVKQQKPLRPDCLEPTNCAGYGAHTCHRCTVAARESEVA